MCSYRVLSANFVDTIAFTIACFVVEVYTYVRL